jgi:hypothetical protein
MKQLFLIIITLPFLSSCGATGRLVGTAVRLPVDIVRAGAGMYQEGEAPHDFSGSVAEPQPLGSAQ